MPIDILILNQLNNAKRKTRSPAATTDKNLRRRR